jgi:hypothetical protein
MRVRDLLTEIAERGITLTCGRTGDRLNAKPTAALTPLLMAEITEHKTEIIEIMRERQRKREDRALEETGVIQSERQVFDMARRCFGAWRKEADQPEAGQPQMGNTTAGTTP